MIWQFLLLSGLALFFWKSFFNKKRRDFLKKYGSLILVLGLVLAIVSGRFIEKTLGFVFPVEFVKTETTKLSSVVYDCPNNFGCTFLVSENRTYYYKSESGEGFVITEDDVAVFEEKRSDGELQVYSYQFKNPLVQWIALEPQGQRKYYTFIIPKGGNLVVK